jgi:hypothetical protein
MDTTAGRQARHSGAALTVIKVVHTLALRGPTADSSGTEG